MAFKMKMRLFCQFGQRTFVRCNSSKTRFSSHQYCVNLVRVNDFENYLSTLLINGPVLRQCAFAVRAFNVELARAACSVSDDKLAQMRLHFWNDAIEKMYDKNRTKKLPEHPAIFELNNAVKKYKLSKQYLQRLIQARQRPSNIMFSTKSELEQYVETSTSSVYYLLLKILGIENINADHAISHMAKAQGICNILRTLSSPDAAGRALPPIPQDVLLEHGCSHEQIIRQRLNDVAVQNCIYDIASLANIHLEKSRKLSNKVPNEAKILFLPAIATERFLERLRSANFKFRDVAIRRSDSLLPIYLYWNKIRKTY